MCDCCNNNYSGLNTILWVLIIILIISSCNGNCGCNNCGCNNCGCN
ncbi:MAG: hypothetical protein J1F64_04210 [Oscillospiraceae bacterium]|nr:hypothetical protein [Oscillospiraceae bacterium]